ncbi:MAG TPA: hypothetical protein VD908_19530 [Cytophagales bacterium]|nr:hypothetical protein [Cytophagales bacterium]
MSTKKKKPNIRQVQKNLAAQYRRNFFSRMKDIIDSIYGKAIFKLIPQDILDYAYLARYAPFKFEVDYNCDISKMRFEDIKAFFSVLSKSFTVQLLPTKLEISVNEFFTVFSTIHVVNSQLSDSFFEKAGISEETLDRVLKDKTTVEKALMRLYEVLNIFNFTDVDLSEELYVFDYNVIMPEAHPGENRNVIRISSVQPERIVVAVDGNTRPAIRVGWVLHAISPTWLSLRPSELGLEGAFAEIPLKVYIQLHAINRLSERLDCFWEGMNQYNMFCSLSRPVIARDSNNNLLIECTVFGKRVGYFRADIVEGIILIRTFLFITNNGTPEGRLLEKTTGLQKLDKKYLAIDKLSTFMTSDLDKNEEVRRIFKTAGCQSLLDLFEDMKGMAIKQANAFNSELMLKYISSQHFASVPENPKLS